MSRDRRERDRHSHNPIVRYFSALGPGLVTGASDDDPAGITTYSVAGAAFGYGMLWTVPLTFPLVSAIQLVCARIGLVSGRGLAGALRQRYPRGFLYVACVVLLIANVFNIAADLAGMGDAAEMLTGVPSFAWVVGFGLGILAVTLYTTYATFARYLKWLSAALFCYIASAVLARPDWTSALHATLVPHLAWSRDSITTFVGIIGTTISPYLFFWQASQEVEEERQHGRSTIAARRGATAHELTDARLDVNTGIVFSNVVMYFIMLATATTLYRAGQQDITSSRQAAEALRPLAGDAASLLFAIGLIGAGLLAIPVLAGSASYAVAELFAWPSGLDLRPRQARRFYAVMVAAVAAGIVLDVFATNPIRMLFWSAILNGLLAPPLMVLVMLVGNNRRIMGEHANGPWLNVLGWTATALMSVAALAFFLTLG